MDWVVAANGTIVEGIYCVSKCWDMIAIHSSRECLECGLITVEALGGLVPLWDLRGYILCL